MARSVARSQKIKGPTIAMTDRPLSFTFRSTHCKTTSGIMLELITEQNLAAAVWPCCRGLYVATMWWHHGTVPLDHKQAWEVAVTWAHARSSGTVLNNTEIFYLKWIWPIECIHDMGYHARSATCPLWAYAIDPSLSCCLLHFFTIIQATRDYLQQAIVQLNCTDASEF